MPQPSCGRSRPSRDVPGKESRAGAGRLSGMTSEIAFGPAALDLDADHGFDVLGRLGMKMNGTTLAYAIGGYGWQHFDATTTGIGSPASALSQGNKKAVPKPRFLVRLGRRRFIRGRHSLRRLPSTASS